MSAETVVRDEVTRMGQHWVEVMRMGRPVERERWVERAPAQVGHLVKTWERHEELLDVYRLYVWWPARELVRLDRKLAETLGCCEAVIWFLEKGQTVRSGAENASALMWVERDRLPGRLWLRELPRNAPQVVELVDWPGQRLEICALPWVPMGFVVVG